MVIYVVFVIGSFVRIYGVDERGMCWVYGILDYNFQLEYKVNIGYIKS